MHFPELESYGGDDLPAPILRMLNQVRQRGVQLEVSAHAGSTGKTINLMWKGERIGYVNPTVLSRGGVLGYHFRSAGTNSCPGELKGRLDSWFCDRLDCTPRDFITHDGGGSNSGRTYLIVTDADVATRAVLRDAGLVEHG